MHTHFERWCKYNGMNSQALKNRLMADNGSQRFVKERYQLLEPLPSRKLHIVYILTPDIGFGWHIHGITHKVKLLTILMVLRWTNIVTCKLVTTYRRYLPLNPLLFGYHVFIPIRLESELISFRNSHHES